MTTAVARMNSVAKRIMSATPEGASAITAETRPPDASASEIDRVVQLFAAIDAPEGTTSASAVGEDDWGAALDLVRSTAARVRALHQRAHAIAQDAHQIVSTATASAQAAEERARRAEAAAQTALARVTHAEDRSRALEDKLRTAEERAGAAEAKTAEALSWLRRMHECVAGEFSTLTITPIRPKPVADGSDRARS